VSIFISWSVMLGNKIDSELGIEKFALGILTENADYPERYRTADLYNESFTCCETRRCVGQGTQ
jgi:hypothetical protein